MAPQLARGDRTGRDEPGPWGTRVGATRGQRHLARAICCLRTDTLNVQRTPLAVIYRTTVRFASPRFAGTKTTGLWAALSGLSLTRTPNLAVRSSTAAQSSRGGHARHAHQKCEKWRCHHRLLQRSSSSTRLRQCGPGATLPEHDDSAHVRKSYDCRKSTSASASRASTSGKPLRKPRTQAAPAPVGIQGLG